MLLFLVKASLHKLANDKNWCTIKHQLMLNTPLSLAAINIFQLKNKALTPPKLKTADFQSIGISLAIRVTTPSSALALLGRGFLIYQLVVL